jgi:hypothetical protein
LDAFEEPGVGMGRNNRKGGCAILNRMRKFVFEQRVGLELEDLVEYTESKERSTDYRVKDPNSQKAEEWNHTS